MSFVEQEVERDVIAWLREITEMEQGDDSLHDWLKDGKVLCKMVNVRTKYF